MIDLTHNRLSSGPGTLRTVLALLYGPLPALLLDMMLRTMALELNVAGLQGLLHGETPGHRFQRFVDRLRQPEIALALLREYPVLARRVVTRLVVKDMISYLSFD